jgi:hypothetical protein
MILYWKIQAQVPSREDVHVKRPHPQAKMMRMAVSITADSSLSKVEKEIVESQFDTK